MKMANTPIANTIIANPWALSDACCNTTSVVFIGLAPQGEPEKIATVPWDYVTSESAAMMAAVRTCGRRNWRNLRVGPCRMVAASTQSHPGTDGTRVAYINADARPVCAAQVGA
jgi:hypothetical protein